MIINQSTVVGQTTAESVIEFSKNDIRDIKETIVSDTDLSNSLVVNRDITVIALNRKNAVVSYTITPPSASETHTKAFIHYKNGVTEYNENWTSL